MVLPFADLVLLACNSATAIVTSSTFAVCLLGEKFMPKYDLTALGLIIAGNTLTIVQSNKRKDDHTAEEVAALFQSTQTILFFICASTLLYTTFQTVSW